MLDAVVDEGDTVVVVVVRADVVLVGAVVGRDVAGGDDVEVVGAGRDGSVAGTGAVGARRVVETGWGRTRM